MAGLLESDPVKFEYIIKSQRIIPGDEIVLLPGIYTGDWIINAVLTGTEAAPIKIKPKTAGTVIIDGSLQIDGSFVELYDIDFTDSRVDRKLETVGITCNTQGFGLYGCIIANQHASGVMWYGSGIGNISENMFLLNGFRWENDSGHGHGIYTHNNGGGLRTIARNIFFVNLGDYTIHIYSVGSNYLKDYNVQNNIINNYRVHTGGGLGLINFLYENNIQYKTVCQQGRYSPDGTNDNGIIRNNTFIDLTEYYVKDSWSNLTESNNIVYGGQPTSRTGYTLTEKPTSKTWFIPYTKSARWVGSIAVYNYAEADTVAIDLTGLIDAGSYKLRNGHNTAETWAFEYITGSINIPMKTWTAASYIGDNENITTTPIFGAFVVEKA